MVDITQVQEQISQAKLRAEQQKQEIESRRKEAKKAEIKLKEQERKLPVPSQRRLRSGLYAGLEGRKRRQAISDAKKELGKKSKEIGLFKKELTRFEEQELKPFEGEIGRAELELKDYKKHQEAIELATKVYYGDVDTQIFFFGENPLAKDYYDKMKQIESAQVKAMVSSPSSPNQSIDRRPIVNGNFVDFTPATNKYEQIGSSLGGGGIFTERSNLPSFTPSINLKPPRTLPRTDKLKDFNPLTGLIIKNLPEPNILNKPFTTTGSPIRRTTLGSLKSRGYIKDKRPIQINNLRRVKKTEQLKPITKVKYNELFFDKSNKKKSKKNLWGF
jgi:hypothetical protein